jgi:ferritin-like metal-binding protein YciE
MTLIEVFEDNIKDLYNAEKQLTKALPKLVKKATNPELRTALENHLGETEEHVRRLEQCAEMLGIKPTGKVCHGMMGVIDEANEHVGELEKGAVMDAVIIECGQKAEHYEIAGYGTICEWGKILGKNDVVKILKQTIAEEEKADAKLSQIAESKVNQMALQESIGSTGSKGSATSMDSMKTDSKTKAGMGSK